MSDLDPAVTANNVISLLTPFITIHSEKFIKVASKEAYAQVGNIAAALKSHFAQDDEAAAALARFEQKPDRYRVVLKGVLQEKLAEDAAFNSELSKFLADLGPSMEVIRTMVVSEVKDPGYPKLPPRGFAAMTPEQYVAERVNPNIAWYDKAANTNKVKYLRMRAATVICGALVPVMVNLTIPYINILTTVISLIVVLLVSLESVYHYREQWTNYRSTEQNLRNEYFYFTTSGGSYKQLSDGDAYLTFVDRVEDIIEAENSATLKVMSTLTETKSKGAAVPAATAE
jgi:hypothetical protein